ncbi:MAG TPA: hypothetical protein VFV52_11430 [Bacilli bacterium]|nr:hypothetical protein [Bacilli bacterium]
MQLTSAFFHKRDISQMKREELEDLDHHLLNRERLLKQKMEQIGRDLAEIASDRQKIQLSQAKTPQA